MKKQVFNYASALTFLVSLSLLLTGCSKKIAVIDSEQSNLGCEWFNPVMETDTGFYYNNAYSDELSLHYYEKETDMNIYLCAKPECTHDGNTFCPATNKNITSFYTAMYDNAVYFSGMDISGNNTTTLSLFRAGFDGTELTKLVDLVKLSNGFASFSTNNAAVSLVIHRGKAFVPYYSEATMLTPSGMDYKGVLGGIVMVDLQTLKCETISEISSFVQGKANLTDFKAVGDCFYYIEKGISNDVFKKFNIKEKTFEEFKAEKNANNFTVIGDEIWYSYSLNNECFISIIDMASGETRKFEGELSKKNAIERTTNEGETFFLDLPFWYSEIMYDGTYLYVSNFEGLKSNPGWVKFDNFTYPERWLVEINIFTLDGEKVTDFFYQKDEDEESDLFCVHVLDGKMYVQTSAKLKSCPVEEIINGSVEWKTEFEFQDIHKREVYYAW